LIILDVLGREIAILVEGERTAGVHEAKWNAVGVPSGIYFYRLQAGDFVDTEKMTMLVDNDSLLIDHVGNPARQNAEEV